MPDNCGICGGVHGPVVGRFHDPKGDTWTPLCDKCQHAHPFWDEFIAVGGYTPTPQSHPHP
jgi:hypothetical protein